MIVLYNCGEKNHSKPGYTNAYMAAYTLNRRFWLCCNMDFIYCLYVFIIKTHIYAWTLFASFQKQTHSFATVSG